MSKIHTFPPPTSTTATSASSASTLIAYTTHRRKLIASGELVSPQYLVQTSASVPKACDLTKRDAQVFAQGFADMTVLITGNTWAFAEEYLNLVLPKDEKLAKILLTAIAANTRPLFRMARRGLLLSLLFTLILIYTDVITDLRIAYFYYNSPDPEVNQYFSLSFAFIIIPVSMQVIITLCIHNKKPLRYLIFRVFCSFCFLNPLVNSVKIWLGEERDETDILIPVFAYMSSRVSDLVFESLPQTMVQTYISFYVNVPKLTLISIVCSGLSACHTMASSSVMIDQALMDQQMRGADSHPYFGCVPDDYLDYTMAMFIFFVGYLLCSVLAVVSFISVYPLFYLLALSTFEFTLIYVLMLRRGQMYINVSPLRYGIALSFCTYVTYYLMMVFLPWPAINNDTAFGGRIFSSLIVYRIVFNALAFHFSVTRFDGLDDVIRSSSEIYPFYILGLSLSIIGCFLVLYTCRPSKRWVYCISAMTGPSFAQWGFDASQLMFQCTTKNHQKGHYFMTFHPSYFKQKDAKEWILSLAIDNELFAEVDSKLPKGIGVFSGHSLDHFFHVVKERYEWYGDVDGDREIEKLFDSLKWQLKCKDKDKDKRSCGALNTMKESFSTLPLRSSSKEAPMTEKLFQERDCESKYIKDDESDDENNESKDELILKLKGDLKKKDDAMKRLEVEVQEMKDGDAKFRDGVENKGEDRGLVNK